MQQIDYIGMKFNKLTILELDEERNKLELERFKNGEIKNKPNKYYKALCECGKIISIQINWLKNGNTKSCGACNREVRPNHSRKKNEFEIIDNSYVKIKLSNCNEYTYVDLEDFDIIKDYCWSKNGKGYAEARFGGRKLHSMHTYLMGNEGNGCKFRVDHEDQNKLNNRRYNLRIVTTSQNGMNLSRKVNNKTGVTGVCFDNKSNKYRAYITKDGKRIELGLYSKLDDAIISRLKAEKELFGEFSGQKHLFEKYNI